MAQTKGDRGKEENTFERETNVIYENLRSSCGYMIPLSPVKRIILLRFQLRALLALVLRYIAGQVSLRGNLVLFFSFLFMLPLKIHQLPWHRLTSWC